MRRRTKVVIAAMACVALGFGHRYTCHYWSNTPVVYTAEMDDDGVILVVGDLQRTSALEHWVLGRERNVAESRRLLRAMQSETNVAGIALLGDLVFDGSSCEDWENFDTLLSPLASRGIMLALGNHDYWGPNTPACRHQHLRFPWLAEQSWSVVRFGELAFVVLDSNEGELGPTRWAEQQAWLRDTLDRLEADEDIRGVALMAHHPPFTNSTLTGDEAHVQESFVSVFEAHPKVVLMLTGHAHAYEHFIKDGVHFVVSGGGGGPRVTLLEGDAARHDDLYVGPSPRPFHYLRIVREDAGLRLEMHGFRTGETAVRELDRFVVDWR